MIKKITLLCVLFSVLAALNAEIRLTGNVTGIATMGIAGKEQSIPGAPDGVYDDRKNGYYLESNFGILFTPFSPFEVFFNATMKSRPGAPYLPLQLIYVDKQDFQISVDTIYGKINIFRALNFDLPVDFFIRAGRYNIAAMGYQNVSGYKMESVTGKMETSTNFTIDLQAVYPMSETQTLSIMLATNYRLNEAVQKLYDDDIEPGKMHGDDIDGEYAPMIVASVNLAELELPFGKLSAEGIYILNAGGFNTGHNAALSAGLGIDISPDLRIPLGIGFAYYEKNTDVSANSVGNYPGNVTTDMRETFRTGLGTGVRYSGDTISADLNLGFSYTHINHIYRDPISLFGASIDGKLTFSNIYFIGAGFVAGTLADARWETNPDFIAEDGNGYDHTFSFRDNFGYEIYAGIKFFPTCRLVLGYAHNQGIAMNYLLENLKGAVIKYKQKGTDPADLLYEIHGVYIKLEMYW
ncbi:hypothetical protein K7I13_01900 [Brucepastera parasyntrophica]|uniref:hypothetical protein n=1 Tax=Brucepastera parasyntrophica TaxID=2880008 RepID=UPI00210B73D7|nr:hypothetical protein [Brucepastera parasyntrophica]ULQ60104.1 hypothetical protein K7I13_01900 [Brucepastera parasyntrophica]